jgi:hypothetical protein
LLTIDQLQNLGEEIYTAIQDLNTEKLNICLKILFSNVTYYQHNDLKENEAQYHRMFGFALRLFGFNIINERLTNIGRIDAILNQKDFTAICEIKYDDDKDCNDLIDDAINQIYKIKYYEPYLDKNIIIIGIGFSNREIEARIEEFKL